MYVVLAVFAIYAFLPSVALSALPVHAASAQDVANVSKYQCTAQHGLQVGDRTSDLACRFAGDPVAGVVDHLGLPDTVTSGLAFYVAILAATILIIATNAGIIGVSRLTYSMGQHRQLPEAIRGCTRTYNTPYVAIILYSLIAILLMIPNGRRQLPRQPVRVRGDAVVHPGPRFGRLDETHDAGRRPALAWAHLVLT